MEIVRAGDLAGSTYLYRDDWNAGESGVVNYPHVYLGTVNAATNLTSVAFGAQRQIAAFFSSDGKTVSHPEPRELWESPIALPLPDDLMVHAHTRSGWPQIINKLSGRRAALGSTASLGREAATEGDTQGG